MVQPVRTRTLPFIIVANDCFSSLHTLVLYNIETDSKYPSVIYIHLNIYYSNLGYFIPILYNFSVVLDGGSSRGIYALLFIPSPRSKADIWTVFRNVCCKSYISDGKLSRSCVIEYKHVVQMFEIYREIILDLKKIVCKDYCLNSQIQATELFILVDKRPVTIIILSYKLWL